MDVKKPDPLDSLFIKGDEVNRELLRKILFAYVRLDEKGDIFPQTPFYALTNKNKLVIILLSRKAIALKTASKEAISPSKLAELVDMPQGSLRPTLRTLVEEGLADDAEGNYRIFPHAVQRCAELLAKNEEKEEGDAGKLIKGNLLRSQPSMSSVIEDLIRQGGLDEEKNANEIFQLVLQRRPGTIYNALYKVLLDLVDKQKLQRVLKEDKWFYRRSEK